MRRKLQKKCYQSLFDASGKKILVLLFASVKRFGVSRMRDGRFDGPIEKVVKKVHQKIGWILRTFYTRRTDILKQLRKSLVQCHIDFCSQLYMPGSARRMQNIEGFFFNEFSAKILNVRAESYWTRLSILQMYSQKRGKKRYWILFVWKILEGHAPNCGIICSLDS